MATVQLRRSGARQFVGTDERNHTFVTDAAPNAGGQYAGLKPSELLPFAIGSCIGVTLVGILEKQRQGPFDLDIDIEFEQEENPPWPFTRIALHYKFTGDNLGLTRVRKAIETAEQRYCAVTASLKESVKIETRVTINPRERAVTSV
jgi:putative redox protein